jgi:hypothetical protein
MVLKPGLSVAPIVRNQAGEGEKLRFSPSPFRV